MSWRSQSKRNDKAQQIGRTEPPPRSSARRWAAIRGRILHSTVAVGGGRSPLPLHVSHTRVPHPSGAYHTSPGRARHERRPGSRTQNDFLPFFLFRPGALPAHQSGKGRKGGWVGCLFTQGGGLDGLAGLVCGCAFRAPSKCRPLTLIHQIRVGPTECHLLTGCCSPE